MALQVVGVGLGRTGTNSLKLALEQLLGGPCHHMLEIFEHPEQIPLWQQAADGSADWPAIYTGYEATVDWPSAAFWRELVGSYPDALVILSQRESADAWWRSASQTIFQVVPGGTQAPPPIGPWMQTVVRLLADRHGIDPTDERKAKAGYEAHLAEVRAEVPPARLLEWTTGDGWAPLCERLGMPVPDDDFPHVNTTEEFRARLEDPALGP
ncbi:MAG TPA: sulfotransferase [Acidimicrobiales bacterium]|nr:sulfotransferase [Acidimicrobiales bacterium]